MTWQDTFSSQLVTADAAVQRVKSGDLVRLAMGPVPVTLVTALARRRDELRDVRVLQGATRHPHPWTLFRHGTGPSGARRLWAYRALRAYATANESPLQFPAVPGPGLRDLPCT